MVKVLRPAVQVRLEKVLAQLRPDRLQQVAQVAEQAIGADDGVLPLQPVAEGEQQQERGDDDPACRYRFSIRMVFRF